MNNLGRIILRRTGFLLVALGLFLFGLSWDAQAAVRTWDGSASTDWATAANWSGDSVPVAGDDVVINGSYTNAPTLDLAGGAVTVNSLSVGSSAVSVLTFSNSDSDSKRLIVTNDVTIGAQGTLTHTANATTQQHMLHIEATNLSIASGGKIDVNLKGYRYSEGPGQGGDGSWGAGAGYGGRGSNSGTGQVGGGIYGSESAPVHIGSGGGNYASYQGGAGGGAVKLNLFGTLTNNGAISSNGGTGQTDAGGGSGGSVYVLADTITGNGSITANGGNGEDMTAGGGGGGRIALTRRVSTASFSPLTVSGGTGANGGGAVGTIYQSAPLPSISTQAISDLGETTVTGNGTVDALRGNTLTQHGHIWSMYNPTPAFITATPVAHWKMNDNAADTTVTDAMGNNNGTAQRNTSAMTATGKISSALNFNGSTDFATVNHNSSNNLTNNFTITAWINRSATSSHPMIVAKANGHTDAQYEFYLYNQNQIAFWSSDFTGDWTTVHGTTVLNTGQWYHVAATYSNGAVKFYVNGVLDGEMTVGGTIASDANNALYIGKRQDGLLYQGMLDDVRIYNSVLSATDITNLYNGGQGTETLEGGNGKTELGAKTTTGAFSSSVTGLTPSEDHYIRAYARSSAGDIVYGAVVPFTTYGPPVTATWTGAVSSNWNTAGNWSTNKVPNLNMDVVINGSYTNAPTLDLASGPVTIRSLTIGSSAASVLTLSNADSDTKKLIVRYDVTIGVQGTLTHTANTTSQLHMVNVEANNVTIASGGKIDVVNKGYAAATGPGYVSAALSAGHGGAGGYYNNTPGGPVYGSIKQPATIGSGSYGTIGAGAVKLTVSGTLNVAGSVNANGQGASYASGSTGGSIWITAGSLAGSGIISANGGTSGYSSYPGGGGGRIAVYYTNDSSSLIYQAFGGKNENYTYAMGGAGTIFKKSAGQAHGSLIIDNNDQDSWDDRFVGRTLINETQTFDTVTIQNYGNLETRSATFIDYDTLNWSNQGIITDNGGTISPLNTGGTLIIPASSRLVGNTARTFSDVTVNGMLTHTSNHCTDVYKLNYTVTNNVTVSSSGQINTNEKGFTAACGTGYVASGWAGPGHGGSGAGDPTRGPAYGSVKEPVTLGSGGYSGGGGGAIKLTVGGTLNALGNITSNGHTPVNYNSGSGGSVWITADTLAGSAMIAANGGTSGGTSYGAGAGGRIALYYTTDNSSSAIQAYGGKSYTSTNRAGGAGTIFKKAASQTNGDLIIDNNDQDDWDERYIGRTPVNETLVLDTITVQNYGNLETGSSTNITYNTLNWSNQGVITDNGGTFALLSGGGDLTIPTASRVAGNTARTFSGLTVNGVLTHSGNITTEAYKLNYTVTGDMTVSSTGAVNVNHKGYRGGSGPGFTATGWSGAGHGGTGGYDGARGAVYGSIKQPETIGSGGYIDAGGGAIKLTVGGTLNAQGNITSNGQTAVSYTPGTGGSIWITAGTLAGNAIVSANAGTGGGTSYGGSAGGRIAVYSTTDNANFSYQAYGGKNSTNTDRTGGAGTIFKKLASQSHGDLIIDNNDQDSFDDRYIGRTLVNEAQTFNTVTIQNYGNLETGSSTNITYDTLNWSNQGVITDNGGAVGFNSGGQDATVPATARYVVSTARTFNSLTVNGMITHLYNATTEQYKVDLTTTNNFTLGSSGSIDVRYRGYQHSEGPGAGTDNSTGSSGGTYGGQGGVGRGTSTVAATYGSDTAPVNIGSGGGDDYYPGGSGGGAVKITAGGIAGINGAINANGQNYYYYNSGGGSGGSIYISGTTLTGSGSLSANGGSGHATNGGGGGGGRIALNYTNTTATLTSISVDGGGGYRMGQAGTIYPTITVHTVSTQAATDVTSTSASGHGTLDTLGFYGVTQHGHQWWSNTTGIANPIAHWKLNENAGNTTVSDSSGNGYNGTSMQNTDTIDTTGKINGALQTNQSSYITGTSMASITGNFSLCTWLKRTDIPFGTNATIVDIGAQTDITGFGLWINGSTNQVGWRVNNDYSHYKSSLVPALNTWEHYCVVYNGSTMKIYRNGAEATSETYTSNPAAATTYWRIGKRRDAYSEGFNGAIDDVRVYNFALASKEVGALYSNGMGTEDLNPISRSVNQLGAKISTGAFTSNFSALMPSTTYYTRAYATSSDGATVYGDTVSFTTESGGSSIYWDGSESSDWATAGNWNTNQVPTSGADIVINGNYTNAPVLDLGSGAVTINSLTLGNDEASQLTISNGDSTNKKLVVTGNLIIGSQGTLTHTANTTTPQHMLHVEAANLTVESGGKIDVKGKGYNIATGPGLGAEGSPWNGGGGAGHGGVGGTGTNSGANGGTVYGSLTDPVTIGSGGEAPGATAAKVVVL